MDPHEGAKAVEDFFRVLYGTKSVVRLRIVKDEEQEDDEEDQ
jgi:hypothetical protein